MDAARATMNGLTRLTVANAQSVPVLGTSRKNTNMPEHYGEDWTCEKCGRKMNPHGDCRPCERKERDRAEAAGEIKRAKNIVAGDVISTRWSFKIDPITVHTVEITPKGKVVINRGRGCMGGEDVFEGEQWINIVFPSKEEETLDKVIEELEAGLAELKNPHEEALFDNVHKHLHPNSRAHRHYFWPLWQKLLYSLCLIGWGLFFVFIIIWLKVGAFLGVKSYKDKYVPVLFCGLVPVFHDWDKMWKENPPSHY